MERVVPMNRLWALLIGLGAIGAPATAEEANVRTVQVERGVLRSAPEPLSGSLVVLPLGTKITIVGPEENDYDPVDARRVLSDNQGLETKIQVRDGFDLSAMNKVWIKSSDTAKGEIDLKVLKAPATAGRGGDVAAFRGGTEGTLLRERPGGDVSENKRANSIADEYAKRRSLEAELAKLERLQNQPSYRTEPFALADELCRFGYDGRLLKPRVRNATTP